MGVWAGRQASRPAGSLANPAITYTAFDLDLKCYGCGRGLAKVLTSPNELLDKTTRCYAGTSGSRTGILAALPYTPKGYSSDAASSTVPFSTLLALALGLGMVRYA